MLILLYGTKYHFLLLYRISQFIDDFKMLLIKKQFSQRIFEYSIGYKIYKLLILLDQNNNKKILLIFLQVLMIMFIILF